MKLNAREGCIVVIARVKIALRFSKLRSLLKDRDFPNFIQVYYALELIKNNEKVTSGDYGP